MRKSQEVSTRVIRSRGLIFAKVPVCLLITVERSMMGSGRTMSNMEKVIITKPEVIANSLLWLVLTLVPVLTQPKQ